jgi:hypothetical protein
MGGLFMGSFLATVSGYERNVARFRAPPGFWV